MVTKSIIWWQMPIFLFSSLWKNIIKDILNFYLIPVEKKNLILNKDPNELNWIVYLIKKQKTQSIAWNGMQHNWYTSLSKNSPVRVIKEEKRKVLIYMYIYIFYFIYISLFLNTVLDFHFFCMGYAVSSLTYRKRH